tara:strand:+ start:127 stop:444 length:318 start_codon:yes stop_codon:yes gene_type:complete
MTKTNADLKLQFSNLLDKQEQVKTSVLKTWTILEDITSVYKSSMEKQKSLGEHHLYSQQINIEKLFKSITTLYAIHFEELDNNVDDAEVMIHDLASTLWSYDAGK